MEKIFVLCFLMFIIFSCPTENAMIRKAKKHETVDLSEFIDEDFDDVYIVDANWYISDFIKNIAGDYNAETYDYWGAQKIYFVKDNMIIKQINCRYYISEPDSRDYIRFIMPNKVKYIKRSKENTCFTCDHVYELTNGFKKYCFRSVCE